MSDIENIICNLPNSVLPSGFCAFTLPVEVSNPRGIVATVGSPTDFFTVERGSSSVVYVFDSDSDGIPDSRRTVVQQLDGNDRGLTHGLAIYDGYIYASSDENVYRWSFDESDQGFNSIGDEEIIIFNINDDGDGNSRTGHRTRTLEFPDDDSGQLYVSVGSVGNVDDNEHRSRIRRFQILDASSFFPIDYQDGEIFADGLRNEVGLAFDVHGVLWGVENGADNLWRDDLGGDIHNDNPAEELNRFREGDAGKHWGYPYCWTQFSSDLNGEPRGTVWAWPSFLEDGTVTDQQCRDNYVPPIISMQAHSAPLGIVFYKWKPRDELPEICANVDPFPQRMDGYAFIAFHGSWNRVSMYWHD